MGQQRPARRARSGHGLRRRCADSRNSRGSVDLASGTPGVEDQGRERRRSHEAAADIGASPRLDGHRFRFAVHQGQAGHLCLPWISLADSSPDLPPPNRGNLHVPGYKEEGHNAPALDMAVLNDMDRFHLAMDAVTRLPQTGSPGIYLQQQLRDKLIEHKHYIDRHGQDMPEICDWTWPG